MLVMSAASVFVVVMSASTLMVSASTLATTAVASATATVHVAEHSFNLILCSLAVFDDIALEVKFLACEFRNVKKVDVQDVKLSVKGKEYRKAWMVDNVKKHNLNVVDVR